ncbi:MAG: PKD domain-containing protein, partial [Flavobacteriales bacterium]|nr:PKD domain-containing protein [Flavobacteriales bacterium]
MKKYILFVFCLFLFPFVIQAQEDCTNGIDDDSDGLIDLNDDECECAGLVGEAITSLIPNPSFEEMSCCPTFPAELTCADTWIQASTATSDYFNTCGITAKVGMTPPLFPLPGGGDGYAGFYEQGSAPWQEYVGACLTSPMLAGTPYVLNLSIAWGDSGNDLDLAIFGTPDCADLPWADNDCPIGEGSWELLDVTPVVVPMDGSWINVTLNFTPTVDINAVCIGSDCEPTPSTWDFFYVDELVLLDSASFASSSDIVESGSWCAGDLELSTSIDTVGGSWQWYLEGVALVGETDPTLDVMPTGPGTYQAVYYLDGECDLKEYTLTIPNDPVASFNVDDVCDPNPVNFTDGSTVDGGTITAWDWDFGDGNDADEASPSHTYDSPGTYDVTLSVTSDAGCTDDTTITVEVFPAPEADFEFEINGISSADGLTGGCIANTVDFVDGSSVDAPGSITDWNWTFGDTGGSSDQNPSHNYGAAGTYTINLTVTTDNGCTDNFNMPIVMTSEPDISIVQNNPTCFGYSDGSFTVLISGGAGGEGSSFIITNEDDETINIGGSNAVNSLAAGTYYYDVDDGGGCTAEGSVIITEPEEMEIEMDLGHIACHGDATGYAIADTVYNAQGPKDLIVYIWSTGENGPALDSIGGLVAGDYELDITDSAGCAASTTFTITEPPMLEFSEIGYEPAYCRLYHYQSGSGQVYAAATGGTPDYTYLWENLGTGATSINTTWGGLNPGDYEITVTDNNGCILTQVIVLDSLNPFSEFDVVSQQLNANLEGTATVCVELINQSMYFTDEDADSDGDSTFWWNFNYPDAQTTLHQDAEYYTVYDTCYEEGGTYEICLKIQNKNGCEHESCQTITVFNPLKVVPPNIFTPDGDGVNDVFTFDFLSEGIQTFNCIIVNRWGVQMAEIDNVAA